MFNMYSSDRSHLTLKEGTCMLYGNRVAFDPVGFTIVLTLVHPDLLFFHLVWLARSYVRMGCDLYYAFPYWSRREKRGRESNL